MRIHSELFLLCGGLVLLLFLQLGEVAAEAKPDPKPKPKPQDPNNDEYRYDDYGEYGDYGEDFYGN